MPIQALNGSPRFQQALFDAATEFVQSKDVGTFVEALQDASQS